MSKYMGNVYRSFTVAELKKLRSKKYNRVIKLRGIKRGWFDDKEYEALLDQMRWLDAEIESRMMQLTLDLQ